MVTDEMTFRFSVCQLPEEQPSCGGHLMNCLKRPAIWTKRESTVHLKRKGSRWFYWMRGCSQRKADLCKDINVRWPFNHSGEPDSSMDDNDKPQSIPMEPGSKAYWVTLQPHWLSSNSAAGKKKLSKVEVRAFLEKEIKRSPLFSSSSSVLHSSVKHSSCLSVLCSKAPK